MIRDRILGPVAGLVVGALAPAHAARGESVCLVSAASSSR
jgi:hypothetical protein